MKINFFNASNLFIKENDIFQSQSYLGKFKCKRNKVECLNSK